jgi:L-cysteine/cystine lyase
VVSPFLPEPAHVAAIRALLPATSAGIYLNAGSAGPLPTETQLAMDELSARELAVGRGNPASWPEMAQRAAEARAAVAAVLVADPDDIALTHSTTDGLNVGIGALPWRPGDRVVTTRHEHPGGLGPLLALRERLGVALDMVDIGDGGDDGRTLEAFTRALDQPARAILVSHVLWTTGAVLPLGELAALARDRGVITVVDGAQSAGAIRVVLDESDADLYAVAGHKWLLGPEGMGAMWVRRELADRLVPASTGFHAYAALGATPRLHPGARRFEATGGFHGPSIVGFARSCGWLAMYVGLPWAIERANRMARLAGERLAGIPGVTMLTPLPVPATLVSFRIEGWPSAAAQAELAARSFAILRTIPPVDALRISVGFWTTEDELERFAATVELVAAHTPDTIPARRTLSVLGSDGRPID